jgi:hypothetical protein
MRTSVVQGVTHRLFSHVWPDGQSAVVQQPPSTFGSRQRLPLVPAPQQMKSFVQHSSGLSFPGQYASCEQQKSFSSLPPQHTVSQHPSTPQQTLSKGQQSSPLADVQIRWVGGRSPERGLVGQQSSSP